MGHEKSERCEFWESLSNTLTAMQADGMLGRTMILIDANGRVGSHPCLAIGDVEQEAENDNGSQLREVLSSFDLFAVNTFWPAGWTWQSTRLTSWSCILSTKT